MAIPIAFAFDFVRTITSENAYFLPENFAQTGSIPLTGDENFDDLDFDKIYHDGSTNSQNRVDVHRARMAEVVVRGRLYLENLTVLVCRTIHEERTLRYMLRDISEQLPKIVVERTIGGVFQRKGIFIDDLYAKDGVLHFSFHEPESARKEQYDVSIVCGAKRWVGPLKAGRWKFASLKVESYREVWSIQIEQCVAYQAPILAIENQVV